MTMNIYLNGELRNVPDQTTIQALLEILDLTDKRLAVEVNEELITRSLFFEHQLQDDDRVEIVQAIGGG